MMTCRSCQAHLVSYLHNELSPHLRRRVAYHLDDCAACYALYVQQRELARELQNAVPLIGRNDAPRFDRVWLSVQGELVQPRRSPQFHARYSLALLALLLALLFPWTMGGQRLTSAAPPTQPPPLLVIRTAELTEPGPQGTVVALSVTVNDRAATPEANLRSAPGLSATAAPDNEGL